MTLSKVKKITKKVVAVGSVCDLLNILYHSKNSTYYSRHCAQVQLTKVVFVSG